MNPCQAKQLGAENDELRSAVKQLTERNQLLELWLELTSDGVWDWNLRSQREEYLSPGFKKQLGYDNHELENKPSAWMDRIFPEDLEVALENYKKHLETDGRHPYYQEVRYRHKDGSIVWVICRGVALKDENGEFYRMVGTHTDITRLKAAEERLKKAKEEAEISNNAKSGFLANMSHEIRTPMTAILGYADMLLDPELSPEDQRGYVQIIRRNGQHLLVLINDILDLSKITAGKMTVERIQCSPLELVQQVASLMRPRAEEKGLEFSVDCSGSIPETINSDPTRLRQILLNLAGNAIKFTSSGSVRLTTTLNEAERPLLCFEVRDTGIGLTPEQLLTLFEPFSQADVKTSRIFGGTGLGLAISKRLAEILGGDIVARVSPGEWTSFVASVDPGPLGGVKMVSQPTSTSTKAKGVPGSPESVRENRGLTTMTPPLADSPGGRSVKASETAAIQGARILVADDNLVNQKLVVRILEKAGARVTVSANGKEAVELALSEEKKGSPFHLILMDMQMPVMDGYEATRTLRANDYKLPIIALTASAMTTDRDRCLLAGCDEFAVKPINRQRLLDLITSHVTRAESETSK